MWKILLTAFLTFVSTELDDFVVFVVLFNNFQVKKKWLVVIGQMSALMIVTAVCSFVAYYLEKIPPQYLRFCGIVPILLGIKELFDKDTDDKNEKPAKNKAQGFGIIITAFLITIAASADNLEIYIPIFTKYTLSEKLITMAIFAVLQIGVSILQIKTTQISVVQTVLKKCKHWIVPVVFILLGIFIFFL